jgi:WD40 repeat protein
VRAFAADGRALVEWPVNARELALAPDGAHALAAGPEGAAWLGPAGEVARLTTAPSSAPRVSSSGSWLASRDPGGARLWTADGKPRRLAPVPVGDGGAGLAFSPDDQRLAAGASDGVVLWELDSGRARRLPTAAAVIALAFSPDGKRLAACGDDGSAWLTTLDGAVTPLSHHGGECHDVAFSRDGRWLAVSRGQTVRLFDTATLALRKLRGHPEEVTTVGFSPDGSRLATLAPEGGVRVWPVALAPRTPPDGEPALRAWLDGITAANVGDDGRFGPR